MNTVIVYDSLFGNTEQGVLAIADALGDYGQVRTVRVEHTHPLYVQGVDLLLLGCPTQSTCGLPSIAVIAFSPGIPATPEKQREDRANTCQIVTVL